MTNNTAYDNCLIPLLDALGWRGSSSSLVEAKPYSSKINTIEAYCEVLSNLNYVVSGISLNSKKFDKRLLPCLLVTKNNDVMVLMSMNNDCIKIHDGVTNKELSLRVDKFNELYKLGKFYLFKEKSDSGYDFNIKNWFFSSLLKNKPLFYNALFLSFILNLLILSTPIFVMMVYNKVITTSSYLMLSEFSVGVALALIGIFLIYRIRAEHLALIGAKCDKIIGYRILSQLLYLPPHYTEMATPGAQVARIKDFDRVREFFSGNYISIFFEIPYIFISLIAIAILSDYLVFIPIAMLVIYGILAVIFSFKIQKSIKDSSADVSNMQEFLLESIEKIRVIKYNSSIASWSERYRNISSKAGLSGVKLSLFDFVSVSISEVIMIGSGMLVLAFGALQAMEGQLSIGAMLAVMMIIWRVLAPVKSIFNSLPRLVQLTNSVKQINRLMSLKLETDKLVSIKQGKMKFHGDMSFQRVSFRYSLAYNPSLLGVNFTIKQGSLVAILGQNASGKSTVFKLLLNLYQAQAGAILIDDRDIRQFNSLDLRNSIAYLPQYPELFYGSIAANLRLGDPLADQATLEKVAEEVGILAQIQSMPKGFDTLITNQSEQHLANSFKHALCLARAYLRDSAILLLDEPDMTLSDVDNQRLMDHLANLKGKKTILFSTHKVSHLSQVDSIILIHQGQVMMQGTPDEVLSKAPIELL